MTSLITVFLKCKKDCDAKDLGNVLHRIKNFKALLFLLENSDLKKDPEFCQDVLETLKPRIRKYRKESIYLLLKGKTEKNIKEILKEMRKIVRCIEK